MNLQYVSTYVCVCMYTCICILQIVYTILLVVFSQIKDNGGCPKPHGNHTYTPDDLVAYFCIGHAILWACITVLDRIIQWRHQIIRKKGYLMFYRKMRNIRRVPFVIVSTGEYWYYYYQQKTLQLLYVCNSVGYCNYVNARVMLAVKILLLGLLYSINC